MVMVEFVCLLCLCTLACCSTVSVITGFVRKKRKKLLIWILLSDVVQTLLRKLPINRREMRLCTWTMTLENLYSDVFVASEDYDKHLKKNPAYKIGLSLLKKHAKCQCMHTPQMHVCADDMYVQTQLQLVAAHKHWIRNREKVYENSLTSCLYRSCTLQAKSTHSYLLSSICRFVSHRGLQKRAWKGKKQTFLRSHIVHLDISNAFCAYNWRTQ